MKSKTSDMLRLIGALIAAVGILLDAFTTFGVLAALVFVIGGVLLIISVLKEKWFYLAVILYATAYKLCILIMLILTGKVSSDNAILIAFVICIVGIVLRGIYMKSTRSRY